MDPKTRTKIQTALAAKKSLQAVLDDPDLLREINGLHLYLAPRWSLVISTPGSGQKPDELPLTDIADLRKFFA